MIVLLSDFGLHDPYVAVMKGVIKSRAPRAEILDLTHQIEPQNVFLAAFLLNQSYIFFPKGSVFCCVVDPGVGTSRRAIAICYEGYYFVGPENGLFDFLLKKTNQAEVRVLDNKKYWRLKSPSNTFHGRDIFAPVAASLAKDRKCFRHLGARARYKHHLKQKNVIKSKKSIQGCIIGFDHFGNALTDISAKMIAATEGKGLTIQVGKQRIHKLSHQYEGQSSQLIALINSYDHLELAVYQGSAQKKAKLKVGQLVRVEFGRSQ